jgi:hypothetical protein
LRRCDIRGDRDGADLLGGDGQWLALDVSYDDPHAFQHQTSGDASADSRCPAGYNGENATWVVC